MVFNSYTRCHCKHSVLCVGFKSGSFRCLRLKTESRQSAVDMSFGADAQMECMKLRVNIKASMHNVSKSDVHTFYKLFTWLLTP